MRRQTYGYLPSCTALPLLISQYSLPVPLKAGGWVGLSGWQHIKTSYSQTVTHLSTNWAGRGATSLMWPTALPLSQATAQSTHHHRTSYTMIPCRQTDTRLTAFFPLQSGKPSPERLNQARDDEVAVALAGPYANHLHLAPVRHPRQHLISIFVQARCSSWRSTNSVKALKANVIPCWIEN